MVIVQLVLQLVEFAASVAIAFWIGRRSRDDQVSDLRLCNAKYTERDASRDFEYKAERSRMEESRDAWKERASEWRKLYFETREELKLATTRYWVVPRTDGQAPVVTLLEPIPDPPSVRDADRATVEERRAAAYRRTGTRVVDREVEPTHQIKDGEDAEESSDE